MNQSTRFTISVARTVALDRFLMGFDASAISGVAGFVEVEFAATKIQLGWSVAGGTRINTREKLK